MPSRRRRYRSRPKPQIKKPPANSEITASEVRLVGPEGDQLGVVSLADAKQRAQESETDLVMVAANANPPVVRLMDLGKHVYEQRKKMAKQKAKSKGGDIKGIRIGFKIGEHDLQMRLKQTDSFLAEGHKVKVEMRLRGREKGRREQAVKKIHEFANQTPNGAIIEGNISHSANNISALLIRPVR
jgi:translation initiation factor IF-3